MKRTIVLLPRRTSERTVSKKKRVDGKNLFCDKAIHGLLNSNMLDGTSLRLLMNTCTSLHWHPNIAVAAAATERVLAGAASIANPAAATRRVDFLEAAGAKISAFRGAALLAASEVGNLDLVRRFLNDPFASAFAKIDRRGMNDYYYKMYDDHRDRRMFLVECGDMENTSLGHVMGIIVGCKHSGTKEKLRLQYEPVVAALVNHPATLTWLTTPATEPREWQWLHGKLLKTFQFSVEAGFVSIVRVIMEPRNPAFAALSATTANKLFDSALEIATTNYKACHIEIVDLILKHPRCDPTIDDNHVLRRARQALAKHEESVQLLPANEQQERLRPRLLFIERLLQDSRIASLDLKHAQNDAIVAQQRLNAAQERLDEALALDASALAAVVVD